MSSKPIADEDYCHQVARSYTLCWFKQWRIMNIYKIFWLLEFVKSLETITWYCFYHINKKYDSCAHTRFLTEILHNFTLESRDYVVLRLYYYVSKSAFSYYLALETTSSSYSCTSYFGVLTHALCKIWVWVGGCHEVKRVHFSLLWVWVGGCDSYTFHFC